MMDEKLLVHNVREMGQHFGLAGPSYATVCAISYLLHFLVFLFVVFVFFFLWSLFPSSLVPWYDPILPTKICWYPLSILGSLVNHYHNYSIC